MLYMYVVMNVSRLFYGSLLRAYSYSLYTVCTLHDGIVTPSLTETTITPCFVYDYSLVM